MNHQVTDQRILDKCRELLDAYSASRPYTPTKRLGSDSEYVDAISHTVERFTLTTGMRTRQFVRKQLPNGSGYYESPRSVKSYDIWDDVRTDCKRENFEEGLDKTTFAVECPTCHGSGKETCPSCDGKGGHRCTRQHFPQHGNAIKCTADNCTNGNVAIGARQGKADSWHNCPRCGGTGYMECPDCHGSLWVTCKRCNGDKEITCRTCDGTGHLVYEWFVVQKYKEISDSHVWKPSSDLTDKFYAFDKLNWNSLWDEEVEDGRYSGQYPVSSASESALKVMGNVGLDEVWSARVAKVDDEIDKFKKECDGASYQTSFEHALFEQYDGIVEYNYKYEGKQYKIWINLATCGVEETENGLYASIAEETVRIAQQSEQKGIPQDAIYYYCKADAISLKWGLENGTQKKRISQYRKLGAYFGCSLLVGALGLWIPLLLQSRLNEIGVASVCAALAIMTICLVSLNEIIQLIGLILPFGVAYASRVWFGNESASDMVMREGLLLSILIHGLAVVTLTMDSVQRLPGGRVGLIGGGLLAGVVASLPVAMWAGVTTQSFVVTGAAWVVIPILCFLSIIRLPTRLRAGKMQKFVQKNDGKGTKIRAVIEGRKPGLSGLVLFLLTVFVFGALSVGAYCAGTVLDAQFGCLHMKVLETLHSWSVL